MIQKEMFSRLMNSFESQSKLLGRVATLFVVIVLSLHLLFFREYIELSHELERLNGQYQANLSDSRELSRFTMALEQFSLQLTRSIEQARHTISKFPEQLRRGIMNAPGTSSGGEPLPQLRRAPVQQMADEVMPYETEDLPRSNSVEDIQLWINAQFERVNSELDAEVKAPLLKMLDQLHGRLSSQKSGELSRSIAAIRVVQPANRNWWRAYSGKLAMAHATLDSMDQISRRVAAGVSEINRENSQSWQAIEAKLNAIKAEQQRRMEELNGLESTLKKSLTSLSANLERVGLPFGDIIPLDSSRLLKVYPVLLLITVLWLFSQLLTLLEKRSSLMEAGDGRDGEAGAVESRQFDAAFMPWLARSYLNSETEKRTFGGAMQSLLVSMTLFLIPVWSMADIACRINSFPSAAVDEIFFLYIGAIVLITIFAPVLHSRLTELSATSSEA